MPSISAGEVDMTWMSSRQAARALGIGYRTIRRWREGGYFKPGIHYRRKGPNPESEIIYNIEQCEEVINEFTQQRACELGHV